MPTREPTYFVGSDFKLALVEGRECGECTACCRLPWVDTESTDRIQFSKRPGVSCEHLAADGKGCGVYARRPGVCRKFRCSWLEGFGEDGDRPDRSGMLAFFIGKAEPLCAIQLDRAHPAINFEAVRRLVRVVLPFMRYRLEAPAPEGAGETATVLPELQHPAAVIPQCRRFLAELVRREW